MFAGKTYHVVCLAHLMHQMVIDREEAAIRIGKRIYSLVSDGVKQGAVRPLRYDVFNKSETEAAFRFMASGKHVGKVLIKMREDDKDVTKQEVASSVTIKISNFYPHKSYIVTGGLGGFGLEIAHWLAERGARNLVLTSRYGIRTQYQEYFVKGLIEKGIKVEVVMTEAASDEEVHRLISVANNLGPIGGIFHLAMVLKDAALENMTIEMFSEACVSKVASTELLDSVSRKNCPDMDYFVCFSTIASGYGNAGQTNYGYGSSYLERVCEERRSQGLHGLAIQWGVIGDVGIVADSMGGSEHLVTVSGTMAQRLPSCLATLDSLLQQRSASVVLTAVKASATRTVGDKRDLVQQIGHILGIKDINTCDQNLTLGELGLDSLMAVEIKQCVERDFNFSLSAAEIRGLTIEKIRDIAQRPTRETDDNNMNPNKNELKQYVFNFELSKEVFVRLNPELELMTNNRPLFILPPFDNQFIELAPILSGICRPLIGINYTHDCKAMTSIKELAAFYIEQLRAQYPAENQYDLMGYSFGGLVALEMAVQLGSNVVQKLVLLDSSPVFLRLSAQNLVDVYKLDLTSKSTADAMFSYLAYIETDENVTKLIGSTTGLDEKEKITVMCRMLQQLSGHELDVGIVRLVDI